MIVDDLAIDDLKVSLKTNAFGIRLDTITFSWHFTEVVSEDASQVSYRLCIGNTLKSLQNNEFVYDSGTVSSGLTTGVTIPQGVLKFNTLYYWKVFCALSDGDEVVSYPSPFTTEIGDLWGDRDAVWADSDSKFSFLRGEFDISGLTGYYIDLNDGADVPKSDPIKGVINKVILSVGSSSTPAHGELPITRQYVYNVFCNGCFVGLGPASSFEKADRYDSFDITDNLVNGRNALGFINYDECYSQKLRLLITVFYENGQRECIDLKPAMKGLSGASVYGEVIGHCIHRYNNSSALAENLNSNHFPYDFAKAGFDDSSWSPVIIKKNAFEGSIFIPYSAEEPGRDYIRPAIVREYDDGRYFIDLGKEIVGGIKLTLTNDAEENIQVELRFGEEMLKDANGNDLPNEVRYEMRTKANRYVEYWTFGKGTHTLENTGMKCFRYVNLYACKAGLTVADVKGVAIRKPFDDSHSEFHSSDPELNSIWDLMKYSIQATNQQLYVDSQTRERLCYEGDALVNALSSYCFDSDYSLARYTAEYLVDQPTHFAEYHILIINVVWNDLLYTGDKALVSRVYDRLKAVFPADSMFDRSLSLYGSGDERILVDWPPVERDGFVYAKYNLIWNCVLFGGFRDLARIAFHLGKNEDAQYLAQRAHELRDGIVNGFYDRFTGLFADGIDENGEKVSHSALHSAVFPLYYGLYRENEDFFNLSLESQESTENTEIKNNLVSKIRETGCKMSVYGFFFLLNGLYDAGEGDLAYDILMNREGVRNYYHMIHDLKATITAEAWDPSIKENMTFSHPWATAAATAIVRGIFGVKPLTPGFEKFQIGFQPGKLSEAKLELPTPRGPVSVSFSINENNKPFMFYLCPPNTEMVCVSRDPGFAESTVFTITH